MFWLSIWDILHNHQGLFMGMWGVTPTSKMVDLPNLLPMPPPDKLSMKEKENLKGGSPWKAH
jgi:hypothetical protein